MIEIRVKKIMSTRVETRGKVDLENCAYFWKIPSYAPEK